MEIHVLVIIIYFLRLGSGRRCCRSAKRGPKGSEEKVVVAASLAQAGEKQSLVGGILEASGSKRQRRGTFPTPEETHANVPPGSKGELAGIAAFARDLPTNQSSPSKSAAYLRGLQSATGTDHFLFW